MEAMPKSGPITHSLINTPFIKLKILTLLLGMKKKTWSNVFHPRTISKFDKNFGETLANENRPWYYASKKNNIYLFKKIIKNMLIKFLQFFMAPASEILFL